MLQPRSHASYQCLSGLVASLRTYATAARSNGLASSSTPEATSAVPDPIRSKAGGGFAMRTYKPRTPGVRHLKRPINDHLWKGRSFQKLTVAKKGQARGGRNNSGKITVRHRGGGHKRRIRIVDFHRLDAGTHTVDRIEHDPNRSAHLALLTNDRTGVKSYIIAAEGMRAGDSVTSFRAGIPESLLQTMGGAIDPGMLAASTATRGNCLPLRMIPVGSQIYNLSSWRGGGAVYCRSAGTYAIVISKEQIGDRIVSVAVKLQTGEIKKMDPSNCATMGIASNPHHQFRQLGKAGRKRWLGIRPTVRGLAMNASDHPHGGGRGKSKGNVIPISIWGTTPAKSGYKTRKKRNPIKNVLTPRPRNQGKRRSKG